VRRIWSLALLLVWAVADKPKAQEWLDTAQVHGFLSQGLVLTSANRFFGPSEEGSLDFTEAGINFSTRPSGSLMLAAQGLFRRSGAVNPKELRLDYALADYALNFSQGRMGILVGRVKNPYGLYNETRDVAFTRPTIFLPQSIYFDRTRNLGLASDGGQIYGEYSTPIGEWSLRFAAGWPNGTEDKEFERLVVRRNLPGSFKSRLSYLGRLTYEPATSLRFAITGGKVRPRYDPKGINPFQAGETQLVPLIFSAQYETEKLTLTGEYSLRFLKLRGFGRFLPDRSDTGESYYLQLAYRIWPKLELVGRYDVYFADRDDTSGRKFAALTHRPRHTRFARDFTLGMRLDLTSWWMVRVEYHRVEGTGWLPVSDNPDPRDLQKNWHLFSLLMAFRF
jgi:hypothetical protein